MKISIDDFGGSWNDYYNFKDCFLEAQKRLEASSCYVKPFFKGSRLAKTRELVDELIMKLDNVEFES